MLGFPPENLISLVAPVYFLGCLWPLIHLPVTSLALPGCLDLKKKMCVKDFEVELLCLQSPWTPYIKLDGLPFSNLSLQMSHVYMIRELAGVRQEAWLLM